MEEEQKRADILHNVYVGTDEEIATKEIQEIDNPDNKESEQLEGEGGK